MATRVRSGCAALLACACVLVLGTSAGPATGPIPGTTAGTAPRTTPGTTSGTGAIAELFEQIDAAYRGKQYARLADLYDEWLARKQHVHMFDFFKATQANAAAGRTDAAFAMLARLREVGWTDLAALQNEPALAPLRDDPRWAPYCEGVRAAQQQLPAQLDPERVGLHQNPALAEVQGWVDDATLDAATLHRRLTGWGHFPAPSETGLVLRFHNQISADLSAPYYVWIPKGYDPQTPTPVLVYLRGGIGSPEFPPLDDHDWIVENPLLPFVAQRLMIQLFPAGSARVFFTTNAGLRNIQAQLVALKRILNVDDDRVYLAGFSSGGSGVHAFALNVPTSFAAFVSINGELKGSVYLDNLGNRPLATLVSEHDDYSNLVLIRTLHQQAAGNGAPWTLTELTGQGHYYRPYEDDVFPRLLPALEAIRRDARPSAVAWETHDPQYGRCDWLQLDALAPDRPRAQWHLAPVAPATYQVERNGRLEGKLAPDDSGAVRAAYAGNRFTLSTSRVAALSLWLRPDMVDFTKPVTVVANEKTVFQDLVPMDRAVVASEFQRTFDRKQLAAARLMVTIE